jgi:hypothetical protein
VILFRTEGFGFNLIEKTQGVAINLNLIQSLRVILFRTEGFGFSRIENDRELRQRTLFLLRRSFS